MADKSHPYFVMLASLFIFLSALVAPFVQVTNYDYRDCVGSGVQNWGVDLSEESLVCANSRGLLYFNGNDWCLLETSGKQTLRDVLIYDGRYYAVGEGCIGCWERNAAGRFCFRSYVSQLEEFGLASEEFWFVEKAADDAIYIHSFSCILMLEGDKLKEVVRNKCCDSFFKIGDRLLAKSLTGELYEVRDGRLHLLCNAENLAGVNIRGACECYDGQLALFASDGTIYGFDGSLVRQMAHLTNMSGEAVKVDCLAVSSEGQISIGTLGDGVLLLDSDFNVISQILSPDLADNNIHSMRFSSDRRLWVTMDFGVGCVDLSPRIRKWQDNSSVGFFFDSEKFDDRTYISTSTGLYLLDSGEKVQKEIYPLGLSVIKDRFLCGTTDGILQMTSGSQDFVKISDYQGAHQFEYVAEDGVEYVFASVWAGVVVFKYAPSAGWVYHGFIRGTADYTSIFVEDTQVLWALKPGVGLVRLNLRADLRSVESEQIYGNVAGGDDLSGMFFLRSDNSCMIVTSTGVYSYDTFSNAFKQVNISADFQEYLPSVVHIQQSAKNTFYAVTKNEVLLFNMGVGGIVLKEKYFLGDTSPVFYNGGISLARTDSSLFLSTYDGILMIDDAAEAEVSMSYEPSLLVESVRYVSPHGEQVYVQADNDMYVIPHKASDISVSFTSGMSDLPKAISWRMDGLDKEWHSWQTSGTVSFTDLKSGVYRLHVRDYYDNSLEIILKIKNPIALSLWMVIVYIVLLTSITAGVVIAVNRRQRRREIDRLKAKSYRELQEKTDMLRSQHKTQMRLIMSQRKFIETISAEVDKLKKTMGPALPENIYRTMISAIDDSRSETGNLYSLENYYVDIHYDFMQKFQREYPSLSPSELKFCCLLRANLSTKEIAQILGISSRSVDLKKYRLKTHLGLDKATSLVHFILNY